MYFSKTEYIYMFFSSVTQTNTKKQYNYKQIIMNKQCMTYLRDTHSRHYGFVSEYPSSVILVRKYISLERERGGREREEGERERKGDREGKRRGQGKKERERERETERREREGIQRKGDIEREREKRQRTEGEREREVGRRYNYI